MMQSSLRYDGDSKSLRIHAKERIPLASDTLLQVHSHPYFPLSFASGLDLSVFAHAELDTKSGSPSYLSLMFRHFYPEASASMGMGVQFNKDEKLSYTVQAKRAFPITANGLAGINLKGRYYFAEGFKERKAKGAVELAWAILNFQKEQDVRIKFGYDISNQVCVFP
ncbi:hypothetical protein ZIOFF_019368 [Zingiber officinale]|uniref:Uncharacterized protein n=1 Tax=Zingiber officinale TaxID=94328 RepID=A0A8J5H704_ZINOF|nr:hypothetical protein ZIOFF_019368 [Zingiber officinale]